MGLVIGALAAVIAVQMVLVAGLLRSHADIVRTVDALASAASPRSVHAPDGDTVTDIVGIDALGDAVALSLVQREGSVLLAFLSTTCLTCQGFWEALAMPPLDLRTDVEVVVVTHEPPREDAGAVAHLAGPRTTVALSSSAWEAFGVRAAPYFVLVDAETGRVLGEGAASAWSNMRALVERWSPTQASDGPADPGHLARSTTERLEDVDATLRAAGVGPGHPSLRPE